MVTPGSREACLENIDMLRSFLKNKVWEPYHAHVRDILLVLINKRYCIYLLFDDDDSSSLSLETFLELNDVPRAAVTSS